MSDQNVVVSLPYNLKPAPKVARRVETVDLGRYDADYAGWVIVVNLDADLRSQENFAQIVDDNVAPRERIVAIKDWLKMFLVAWNFVDDEGEPLPQPREGGVDLMPLTLSRLCSEAIQNAIQPKKA